MEHSIAVVHEWLATYAGSERVVEQMLRLFPNAELYSLIDLLEGEQRQMLGGRTVHTSFIARLPFARRYFRSYLPLMPLAVEQWDLNPYDIVISSNHAVAKGVLTRADQLHISYVHTPIRYAWDLQQSYLQESRLTWGVRSILARCILHYLRLWDRASADRVDAFVANSRYVARRIEKTYRRPAHVIYPPVDVDCFVPAESTGDYYLTASRLAPYKRVDVIVEAFRKLPERRLVVIGDGPQRKRLEATKPDNVELLGYQDTATLREHMQRARAFVFAADEDFGIMPVEAQACGTPVIAYGVGGSRETVVDGETGVFFAEQLPASIAEAIERFERIESSLELDLIRANAERFSVHRFQQELSSYVEEQWDRFQRHEPSAAINREDAAWSESS